MSRKILVIAALVVAAAVGAVGSATAGTGPSETWCRDGGIVGGGGQAVGREVQVAPTGITFDVEVGAPSPTYVQVCYSTTVPGNPAATVTGGVIQVGTHGFGCLSDANVVLGVSCTSGSDPATGTPTQTVTVTVQGTPVSVGPVGAGSGGFSGIGGASCLTDVTVIVGSTRIGPHDIGVC